MAMATKKYRLAWFWKQWFNSAMLEKMENIIIYFFHFTQTISVSLIQATKMDENYIGDGVILCNNIKKRKRNGQEDKWKHTSYYNLRYW